MKDLCYEYDQLPRDGFSIASCITAKVINPNQKFGEKIELPICATYDGGFSN
jgi:hypothetical protein